MMPALSLLIKPVSGACNLDCGYCFYKNDPAHHRPFMSAETAEMLVSQAFDCAESVHFGFQGGEPTLAGASFYADFCAFADGFAAKNKTWSIQTNGYDVSDDFIRLFARYGFLVGLSVDGPRGVHDKFRRTATGSSTYPQVSDTLARLVSGGVAVNLLSVVTKKSCADPVAVWRGLVRWGVPYLQFILCLEQTEQVRYQPGVSDYADFLNKTFRLWADAIYAGQYVSERFFDNCIQVALGRRPELCQMTGVCQPQVVIEADGSVYPCDFYVEDRFCCGNIHQQPLVEIIASPAFASFSAERGAPSADCMHCPWRCYCGGGCRKTFDQQQKTIFCAAYRRFFKYNEAEINRIAGMALNGQKRLYE